MMPVNWRATSSVERLLRASGHSDSEYRSGPPGYARDPQGASRSSGNQKPRLLHPAVERLPRVETPPVAPSRQSSQWPVPLDIDPNKFRSASLWAARTEIGDPPVARNVYSIQLRMFLQRSLQAIGEVSFVVYPTVGIHNLLHPEVARATSHRRPTPLWRRCRACHTTASRFV